MEEDEVKIKLVSDTTGADKARKAIQGVGKAAKDTSSDASKSLENLQRAFGGVSRAAGLLRNILSGFGVVGAITGLVSALGRLKASFSDARKEAAALAVEKARSEHREAVDELAKSYDRLAEATRKAAEESRHSNEMLDQAVKNARELEDAQLDLAEQKELDAVDSGDPAAQQRRAEISARYSQRRKVATMSRGREDIVYARQRLEEEANSKIKEATGIEAAARDTDKIIASTKALLADAESRSSAENDRDATGVFSRWGSNLKNIVSLNWGKVGDYSTEEGNQIRSEAKNTANDLKLEISQLEKQKAAKLKEAAALRQEAARAAEKRSALGGQIEVFDTKRAAAELEGRRAADDATRTREQREAQIAQRKAQKAADENTVASGAKRISVLEGMEGTEQDRALAAARRYEKEQGDVFAAQNRYDMVVANGSSRKDQSAALAALQREKEEALAAQHDMERVAAEVAGVLSGIRSEINALSSSMKAAQGRIKQNQTDAPEG